ncbi:nucleosome-remodeling factor subunit NURF301-like [Patiria miniata]|uniref:PHD-type domain-containing protein n=1 Tax=Patiria miniata TaxID=46514 RepID=A0A914BBW6_PATMI|nr:nucleosome-remodeling factor subunit NURF301-like [Patiria miniata]XP_038073325.1 nucleosome-remodeling factor subunit NURF301-like [Patiria miniata]XP_038073333.1 nucleosome-remodeling factor subunit NURF301-like [Patiria miniata]
MSVQKNECIVQYAVENITVEMSAEGYVKWNKVKEKCDDIEAKGDAIDEEKTQNGGMKHEEDNLDKDMKEKGTKIMARKLKKVKNASGDLRLKVKEMRRKRLLKLTKKRVHDQRGMRRLHGYLKIKHCTRNSNGRCMQDQHENRSRKKHIKVSRKRRRRDICKESYNRRRNGMRIELWMSKEEKAVHEKVQKNAFCETKRSLSFVLKKMKDVSTENKNKKRQRSNGNFAKVVKEDVKHTCASEMKTPERRQTILDKKVGKSVLKSKNSQTCDRHRHDQTVKGNQSNEECWLCDQTIDVFERKVQCDGCNIWYHVKCMNFLKMEELLANRAVVWMCRKCGKSTYSQSLLYDLGIPTDDNVFEMTVEETCTIDDVVQQTCIGTCAQDSNWDDETNDKSARLYG